MSVYVKYITNNVLIPIFGENFKYEINSYFPLLHTTYINVIDTFSDQICLSMNITTDVLHVSLLKKTPHVHGNVLISNIKTLAEELNVPEITLNDSSSIEYGVYDTESHKYYLTIDLYVLHILLYGESWYNKKGFYMKDGNKYAEYCEHNKKLLQMSMGSLLRIYIQKCTRICNNFLLNPSCVNYTKSHGEAIDSMRDFVLQYFNLKSNTEIHVENISEIDRNNILEVITVKEFMRAFKNYKLLKNDMSYMTVYLIYLINFIQELYYYDENGNETVEPLLKYDYKLTNNPVYNVKGEFINA